MLELLNWMVQNHVFIIIYSLAMAFTYGSLWFFFYVRKDGLGRLFLLMTNFTLAAYFMLRGAVFICHLIDPDNISHAAINANITRYNYLLALPALFMLSYFIRGKHQN